MMMVDGNTKIYEFDGVDSAGVYIGFPDRLVYVGNVLRWNKDQEALDAIGEALDVLTLDEIRKQLFDATIITVIVNRPLSGVIYQYGNYADGEWYKIGDLNGYA